MSNTLRLAELALVALLALLLISWRADRRDRAQLAAQLAAARQSLAAAESRQHDRDAELQQTLAAITAEKRAANSALPGELLAALQQQLALPAAPFLQSPNVAPSAAPTRNGARSSQVWPPAFAHHPLRGKGSGGSDNSLPGPAATPAAPSPPTSASARSAMCSGRSSEQPASLGPPLLRPSSGQPSLGASPENVSSPELPSCADQLPAAFSAPRENPSPQASQRANAQVVLPEQDLRPLYDFTLDCKACQAKLAASQADLVDEKLKTATLARERDAALKAVKGGSMLRRVARAAKWFAIGAAAGAFAAKAR